jgi:hypothetical protein
VGKSQNGSNNNSVSQGVLRKSARLKPTRHRQQNAIKALSTKGKSRRVVFKKNVSSFLNINKFHDDSVLHLFDNRHFTFSLLTC